MPSESVTYVQTLFICLIILSSCPALCGARAEGRPDSIGGGRVPLALHGATWRDSRSFAVQKAHRSNAKEMTPLIFFLAARGSLLHAAPPAKTSLLARPFDALTDLASPDGARFLWRHLRKGDDPANAAAGCLWLIRRRHYQDVHTDVPNGRTCPARQEGLHKVCRRGKEGGIKHGSNRCFVYWRVVSFICFESVASALQSQERDDVAYILY